MSVHFFFWVNVAVFILCKGDFSCSFIAQITFALVAVSLIHNLQTAIVNFWVQARFFN